MYFESMQAVFIHHALTNLKENNTLYSDSSINLRNMPNMSCLSILISKERIWL